MPNSFVSKYYSSEEWEESARRETLEETGLKLKNVRLGTVLNTIWKEGDRTFHYIEAVMVAHVDIDYKREPDNPEPDKCEGVGSSFIYYLTLNLNFFTFKLFTEKNIVLYF